MEDLSISKILVSSPHKGLHDLPPEIRDQIYGYCSPSVAVLSHINGKVAVLERVGTAAWYTVKSLNILQLDRKTRAEAAAFLYEKCTFAINLRWQLQTSFEAIFGRQARFMRAGTECRVEVSLPEIRHWLIDLKWDSQQYGNSQPRDFRRLLKYIVEEMQKNEGTKSITINHPCECSLNFGGFNILDQDMYNKVVVRSTTKIEGHRAVFDMLEPLARLQISKAVTFVPTVLAKTRFPPYCEYLCKKEFCHQLTNGLKEIMIRTGSPYKDRELWPVRASLGIGNGGSPLEYRSEKSRELQMENRARLCGHF
ncbi:MAG: hypothetical protein LQ338_004678 [Usnochroma carphineum]|nr:MAG: hypothetical protein LQ338_004678 [Usnochroma carphineum]